MVDQGTVQKIVNELIQSKPEELDEVERELLQENRNCNQRIMQFSTQIQDIEERITALRSDKTKLEGVAEYTLNKAVDHRYKTAYLPKEQEKADAAMKSKGNGRPQIVPAISPVQERVTEEAKAETEAVKEN